MIRYIMSMRWNTTVFDSILIAGTLGCSLRQKQDLLNHVIYLDPRRVAAMSGVGNRSMA